MRAVEEGRISYTPTVRKHIDSCLGCLACETACPSGVQYHSLIEAARTKVEDTRSKDGEKNRIRNFALRWILPRPSCLAVVGFLLRLYHGSGLRWFFRNSGLLNRLGRIGEAEVFSPSATPRSVIRQVERGSQEGEVGRSVVALLTGCVMRIAFGHINLATIRALSENGYPVLVPKGQVCCGALHGHSGDRRTARELARKNIDIFMNSGADHVITNSAGCGSMMKEYGELLANDQEYREKAKQLSLKVRDITEFLVENGFRSPSASLVEEGELPVTYHEACHLAHGQKIRNPPREILRSIPGVKICELAESDWCCGSAGIYNLTQPEMAKRLLKRKIKHIVETGASVVATGNPGCIIQIESGLRGEGVEVLHPIELLARAYGQEIGDRNT